MHLHHSHAHFSSGFEFIWKLAKYLNTPTKKRTYQNPIYNKFQNPWGWHPSAETCRSSVLVMNCILVSALVGWFINSKKMHNMSNKEFVIYRMSQEECARLREGVPYAKVYRYNPKHLCPTLNGYGDNGQWSLQLWQLLHTYWLPNTY